MREREGHFVPLESVQVFMLPHENGGQLGVRGNNSSLESKEKIQRQDV